MADISDLIGTFNEIADSFSNISDIADSLDSIADTFSSINDNFADTVASLQELVTIWGGTLPEKEEKAAPSKDSGGGSSIGAALGGLTSIVTGTMAAVQSFVGVVEKLQGFVALFNPGVIELFNKQLDNFNATVGSAFVSLFVDLTDVLKKGAGLIKPLFEALAPVVKTVSDVISNFLLKYISLMADTLKSLVPVLAIVVQVLQPFLDLITIANTIFSTLLRTVAVVANILLTVLQPVITLIAIGARGLAGAFEIIKTVFDILEVVITVAINTIGGFLKSLIPAGDIMKALNTAIQNVIRSLYLMAIQAAKVAGLDSVAEALLKSLESKTKSGDTAAQTASIQSFEQIAKNLTLKSAFASPGGASGVDDEKAFWTETLKQGQAIAAETKSATSYIGGKLTDIKEAILGKKETVDPLTKAVRAAEDVRKGAAFGPAGAAFGAARALLREAF